MKIGIDAFIRAVRLRFDPWYQKAYKNSYLGVDGQFWHDINIGSPANELTKEIDDAFNYDTFGK